MGVPNKFGPKSWRSLGQRSNNVDTGDNIWRGVHLFIPQSLSPTLCQLLGSGLRTQKWDISLLGEIAVCGVRAVGLWTPRDLCASLFSPTQCSCRDRAS